LLIAFVQEVSGSLDCVAGWRQLLVGVVDKETLEAFLSTVNGSFGKRDGGEVQLKTGKGVTSKLHAYKYVFFMSFHRTNMYVFIEVLSGYPVES
jgi:hypothetical protein